MEPPNLEKSLKTCRFLMIFAMSPTLQMMPNMTQKWNIDQKSIKNRSENRCTILMRLGIDFWSILVGLGSQDGPHNRPKIDQKSIWGAHGDPKAAQDPPKIPPRPSQHRKSTPNRPKSTPNPPQIDQQPTQHRPNFFVKGQSKSFLK